VDANWGGGPVLTSKGCSMATIALALTYVGASGWVEVPSGTWAEAVTISNNDVTLRGQGLDSIIDGGTTGHAINISGNRTIIRDLTTRTTPGQANAYRGVYTTGSHTMIDTVRVNGSDDHGIYVDGSTCLVHNCYVYDCDVNGIRIGSAGDNSIIRGNIIDTTADDGIYIDGAGNNCIVQGNRIFGWTNESIDDDSGTATLGLNNVVV